MLLKELREKRAPVAVALRSHIEKEFHARNKAWTTEGRAEFERLSTEIDGLDAPDPHRRGQGQRGAGGGRNLRPHG